MKSAPNVSQQLYQCKRADLGEYFLNSLYSEIDSLIFYAGVLRVVLGFCRALSKRFPFAIFYRFDRDAELVRVYRVLDLRRDPLWLQERLQ